MLSRKNSRNMFIATWVLLAFLALPQEALLAQKMTPQEEANELFLVAQKAFDDGFHDVAIRYIEQFLEKYPGNPRVVQARLLLGQCYFFKKQYLKSYNMFHDLLDQKEHKDATLFWLGETYFKGADFKQAASYYRQVLTQYPDSVFLPQTLYSLGWTEFEQGRYPEAKGLFEQLIKKFPKHTLAEDGLFKLAETEHHLAEYDLAITHFGDYLNQYPQSSRQADIQFFIAEAHYYAGDYLPAITYYAKAADRTKEPNVRYMALLSMGWSYYKLEKLDLAKKYFLEAEDLGKQKGLLSEDVFFGEASLFLALEDYPRVRQAYDEIIGRFPKSPKIAEAYLGRANAMYIQGEYAAAIFSFQYVIDQFLAKGYNDPLIEKAFYGLAWTYLKQGDHKKAIATFEDIFDKSSSTIVKISALTQIANAYFDIENSQKALNVYDRILREFPDSLTTDYVQFRQGMALVRLNQLDAAMLSFQTLQRNFPESKYTHESNYYLGVAHFKKNNWPAAVPFFQAYLEKEGKLSFRKEAMYLLALSHFNQDEYAAARDGFQAILRARFSDKVLNETCKLNSAKTLFHLGQTNEGIKHLNDLIQSSSEGDAALEGMIWLGDYYLNQKDYNTAASYYQQALDKFPESEKKGLILYELGQIHLAKGEYEEALKILQSIPLEAGQGIYGKAKLAIADIFSRERDGDEALKAYQGIAESMPQFQREANVKIAEIHRRRGHYPQALEALLRARQYKNAESGTSDAEVQFLIGDIYEYLNARDKAVDEYLRIPYLFKTEPSWVIKAYLRAGRIFEDAEDWEQAEIVYKKILEFDSEEAKYAQERLKWIRDNN